MRNSKTTMTIAGIPRDTTERLDVINPATENVIASVPSASRTDLDDAVDAARSAFPAWSASPWQDRGSVVQSIGAAIDTNAPELIAMLTQEQGKPTAQAEFEITTAAQWCYATAMLNLPDRVVEDGPERQQITRQIPMGVVAGISPWNFPLLLSIWKIAPALLTGNTMVLKPSPFTPMTVLRLGELVRDVVPKGVLNIISGGDALGPMMTEHPGFDKISFTGSTATGRRVMASAAPTLKRLTLELGGNDAAIVMPDVDVSKTAEALFQSAFMNSGQVCVATKRAYVHADIYDAFRDALADIVKATPVGDGAEQGVVLGPVQNRQQYDRVQELILDCAENGYDRIEGSTPTGQGYFIAPTLIDNPPNDARIVQEEQFGPVLPLIKYSNIDTALAWVNGSDMALAGTIWTADTEAGMKVAERFESGNVWINEGIALSPMAAFGGHKQSGVGVENGVEGLGGYTETKTFVVSR